MGIWLTPTSSVERILSPRSARRITQRAAIEFYKHVPEPSLRQSASDDDDPDENDITVCRTTPAHLAHEGTGRNDPGNGQEAASSIAPTLRHRHE